MPLDGEKIFLTEYTKPAVAIPAVEGFLFYLYLRNIDEYTTNLALFYEPTDRRKAAKPLHSGLRIAYASPNLNELRAMAHFVKPYVLPDNIKENDEILYLSEILSNYIDCLIVTLGAKGVIIVQNITNGHENTFSVKARFYPVKLVENVKNVSGAGDCFASGFLHGVLANLTEQSCVSIGFETAKCALRTTYSVPSFFANHMHFTECSYKTLL